MEKASYKKHLFKYLYTRLKFLAKVLNKMDYNILTTQVSFWYSNIVIL